MMIYDIIYRTDDGISLKHAAQNIYCKGMDLIGLIMDVTK